MRHNGLIATWTFGPTTMKTAMGSWKILPMSLNIKEASFGHAVISEAMQRDARRVSMMSGLSGRMYKGREVSMYRPYGIHLTGAGSPITPYVPGCRDRQTEKHYIRLDRTRDTFMRQDTFSIILFRTYTDICYAQAKIFRH